MLSTHRCPIVLVYDIPCFETRQLQLQEEESMHAEVDKWQRRYQNINYELEVQKTKMKERYEAQSITGELIFRCGIACL